MSYFKKAFGQNLKYIRKIKGYTQEQLAEMVNLNQRQLTRIENGTSFVSSEVIERLMIALNVDVKTLFDFEIKETILCKTGTDSFPYFKIIKNNNVIILQEYNSSHSKDQYEEKTIETSPDDYLINISKKLNKPISAQHLSNGSLVKTYTYNPDGSIKLVSEQENPAQKITEKILDKIRKITENEEKLNYINLALESIDNKVARKKLKNIIDGMDLLNQN